MSRLRDFMRSYGKKSSRLENRDPELYCQYCILLSRLAHPQWCLIIVAAGMSKCVRRCIYILLDLLQQTVLYLGIRHLLTIHCAHKFNVSLCTSLCNVQIHIYVAQTSNVTIFRILTSVNSRGSQSVLCRWYHCADCSIKLSGRHATQTQTSEMRWAIFWRFCMCPSNDTFDKNEKSWCRYWSSTAKTGSLLGIKQT